jgi:hypothetical protein
VDNPDNPNIESRGIFVEPGRSAHASVDVTRTQIMPQPYSNCLNPESIDTRISRVMASLNISYTQENCFTMCQQQLNVNHVGCNDMSLPMIPSAPLCKSREQYEGIINSVSQLNISKCLQWCPNECNITSYEFSVSYEDYPPFNTFYSTRHNNYSFYSSLFGTENITFNLFKHSVAAAFIYFKEIKYTEISEQPSMTSTSLVSGIGGTMGLFLGFSLVICMEYIELMILFVFAFCQKYKSSKSKIDDIPNTPKKINIPEQDKNTA